MTATTAVQRWKNNLEYPPTSFKGVLISSGYMTIPTMGTITTTRASDNRIKHDLGFIALKCKITAVKKRNKGASSHAIWKNQ